MAPVLFNVTVLNRRVLALAIILSFSSDSGEKAYPTQLSVEGIFVVPCRTIKRVGFLQYRSLNLKFCKPH